MTAEQAKELRDIAQHIRELVEEQYADYKDAVMQLTEAAKECGKWRTEAESYRKALKQAKPQLDYIMRAFGCPCGARPESLNTHPHVSGCGIEALLILGNPVAEDGGQ